ncbi:flagellar hook-basal body protein [Mesobacillus harenae]|uniref:flagellar hook-basal body protein n=1 Tax=Mesobacillus harenae TaxID=2213203 RepID=UPI00157FDDE2|nr:flagellar hook-basal body protein [Mesobacillus harenae]
MFRGFYTVASGMVAQQRRTDMLTNNMSNANTPGFKADQSTMRPFPEMLLQHFDQTNIPTQRGLNFPSNKVIGSLNTGVYMQEAIPKFIQGDLRQTDNTTDVALQDALMPVDPDTGREGSVFFTVQNAEGDVRYTRNGSFTLDGQGYLTTASGLYVLNDQGNRIQLSSDRFTVTDNGVLAGENSEAARIGVGFAANSERLMKEGDGLYRTEEANGLPNAYNINGAQFSVKQGQLEQSNVDVSRTMTDMLTAYRSFEANQKILQAYDRSMDKAANEIGRIG